MHSTLVKAALIILVGALPWIGAMADTVRIPVGQDTDAWRGDMPARGATKARVEAQFGAPTSVEGPNGEPPIYFWEYPHFTVYFESDYVIHAVVKQRQKTE